MEEYYGMEMIAPHCRHRGHPAQDGRRRRWTVERFFAWPQWFRRLVTRSKHHIENFFDMARLGCMEIMLRYF
jgi:transposase